MVATVGVQQEDIYQQVSELNISCNKWISLIALFIIMFLKRQCEIVSHIAVMFSIQLGVYEHVFFYYDRSKAPI